MNFKNFILSVEHYIVFEARLFGLNLETLNCSVKYGIRGDILRKMFCFSLDNHKN